MSGDPLHPHGTAHHLHRCAAPALPCHHSHPIDSSRLFIHLHHRMPSSPSTLQLAPACSLSRVPTHLTGEEDRRRVVVRSDDMIPQSTTTSLDLGLSLGLTSQGSLSSSTTAGSSGGGALSPWAAALSSVVSAQNQQQNHNHHVAAAAAAAANMDPDRAAMRASTSPDSAAALSSGASGGDNNSKRELERTGSGGVRSDADDEDGADGAGGRKKLRLSKDQAAVLEECFKTHSTLNPKQKVALANRLGLRPRQVEVWFQNRRARTKLKQTEVDCEYLKRWCERLADENKRLEKELADLRALKAAAPSAAAQPASTSPAATLTMCPSCRRVAANHQQQQCHPKSNNAPAAAAVGVAGSVVPSHCQFFPAAVDRTGQSTWNAAAAPLVTRELF